MEPQKRDYHKEAEDFYRTKFNGQKDQKEQYGDFFVPLDVHSRIGFEVYLPEEPLARSTKDLKKRTMTTMIHGNNKISFMGGGIDPNRRNQLIERALNVKERQFRSNVEWPKVLIVSCFFPHAYADIDSFVVPEVDASIDYKLLSEYPYCSAIFIHGAWGLTTIPNTYARYPLTEAKINELSNLLK